MTGLVLLAQLLLAQTSSRPSDAELIVLSRRWLAEVVIEPARRCVKRDVDEASFWLALDRRGEVSLRFKSASSNDVRKCIEFLAQPNRTEPSEAQLTEFFVVLPERPTSEIIEEVELREPSMPGRKCQWHKEFGAGQACFSPAEPAAAQDAGTRPRGRCVDFLRWLRANPASSETRR